MKKLWGPRKYVVIKTGNTSVTIMIAHIVGFVYKPYEQDPSEGSLVIHTITKDYDFNGIKFETVEMLHCILGY